MLLLAILAIYIIKPVKNAQTLIEQEDATKEQLDEALKQLQDARTQLVLKATDDEVNALKALMDQYQEKDYTFALRIVR